MWAKPMGVDLVGKVIYNMEYLHDNSPLFGIGYLETLKDNIVLDYSKKNVEYLKGRGIDAFYMPYGFHESLSRIPQVNKDVDVLFFGSLRHPRRQRIFKELSDRVSLTLVEGVYGDELDSIVARAKVVLNMHHAEGQPLEVVRVNYLTRKRCDSSF
jgi:hypothetical protein